MCPDCNTRHTRGVLSCWQLVCNKTGQILRGDRIAPEAARLGKAAPGLLRVICRSKDRLKMHGIVAHRLREHVQRSEEWAYSLDTTQKIRITPEMVDQFITEYDGKQQNCLQASRQMEYRVHHRGAGAARKGISDVHREESQQCQASKCTYPRVKNKGAKPESIRTSSLHRQ